jgi:hypothetical protein
VATVVMGRILAPVLGMMTLLMLTSAPATAQVTTAAAAAQGTIPAASESGWPWIVVGGSTTSLLGDCTDCPADTYLHSGGLLAIVGGSLNARSDIGAEVMWVPATSAAGDPIRTTYVMGVYQGRPWRSSGFFLRVSSGMAFVRNWVVTEEAGQSVFTSKAFALALGAGWEWRMARRFGFQVFGAQHVAALGDLTTSTTTVENVVGNFWSVGGAIVIR